MRYGWIIGLIMLGGCSSFDRDYRAVLDGKSAEGSTAWDGTWNSFKGHGGNQLRAIIQPGGEGKVRARFRATFWGFFKADQEALLEVVETSPVKLKGQADLGSMSGGIYRYDATMSEDELNATYENEFDQGEFKLKRVK